MIDGQIKRYERRVAEEERLAMEADTVDIGLAHQQMAMLYRTELSILRRKSAATRAEALAQIW